MTNSKTVYACGLCGCLIPHVAATPTVVEAGEQYDPIWVCKNRPSCNARRANNETSLEHQGA